MSSSAQVRALAVAALRAAIGAGANVYFARTWPTQPDSYPILLVPPLDEHGESWGDVGAPAFNVTTTLRVLARVQEPGDFESVDAGSEAVALSLEVLRDQIKAAIINNPALRGMGAPVQEFTGFRCQTTLTAEGEQPLGQMMVEIDMVIVQGPDDFFQIPSTPFEGPNLTVQEPAGTVQPGFSITLPQ
jgi:hypothetical protein